MADQRPLKFGKPKWIWPMSNDRQIELNRLRLIAQDKSGDGPTRALDQIRAASAIVRKHGLSQRSTPIVRAVCKKYVDDKNVEIQTRARKLLKLFNERIELGKQTLPEEPESAETETPTPEASAVPPVQTADPVAAVAPKISDQFLLDSHSKVLEQFKLVGFMERRFDLSQIEKQKLLEEFLGRGRQASVENVSALYLELLKNAASERFPIIRVTEQWLSDRDALPKKSDGFQRGLIDAESAVARVAAKYKEIMRGANDPQLLQIALGDVPLSNECAKQLWLTFGYAWRELWGGNCDRKGSDVMPPASRWALACLCTYANARRLELPDPGIFQFSDSTAFRS